MKSHLFDIGFRRWLLMSSSNELAYGSVRPIINDGNFVEERRNVREKKQPNLKIQFIHCLPIRMTNRLRYIRWWTLCPIGEFHFETDDDESAFDLTVNRRWSTARRWLKVQFFIKFSCVACAIGDGAWSYRLWNNYVKLAQSVISHSNGKWLTFGMSIFVTRPSAKTLQSHNGCVAVAEPYKRPNKWANNT